MTSALYLPPSLSLPHEGGGDLEFQCHALGFLEAMFGNVHKSQRKGATRSDRRSGALSAITGAVAPRRLGTEFAPAEYDPTFESDIGSTVGCESIPCFSLEVATVHAAGTVHTGQGPGSTRERSLTPVEPLE